MIGEGLLLALVACPEHRMTTLLKPERVVCCRNTQQEATKLTQKGECLQRGIGRAPRASATLGMTPVLPGNSEWAGIEPGLSINTLPF